MDGEELLVGTTRNAILRGTFSDGFVAIVQVRCVDRVQLLISLSDNCTKSQGVELSVCVYHHELRAVYLLRLRHLGSCWLLRFMLDSLDVWFHFYWNTFQRFFQQSKEQTFFFTNNHKLTQDELFIIKSRVSHSKGES